MKINKNQFSFDTKLKDLLFNLRRGQGHQWRYWLNRLRWHYYPRWYRVSRFPDHVDIETTNLCNMKCPMCYRHKMDVKMSCMDLGLFKKIVDECSRNGCFSVRLSWRGEPLVHPEFLEMIRYVKASRIREVNFLTNALCLDERMSEGLIRAGVDWVTVSFDGIGEVYEKIRKPAIYTEAIERLKTFQAIKKRLGLEKPVLKVQSIWTAIKDNPKAYDDALSPIADKVSVIANKDYHGDGKIDHDPGYVCPTVWQRLVVTCNGDVVQCICDAYEDNVVGNAREQSIREIWHGSGMKRVRDLMVLRDRLQLKPCTKCFEGVRYVKEKVALGDRKVTVDMRTNIEHLDELGLAQQTGGGKKEERS